LPANRVPNLIECRVTIRFSRLRWICFYEPLLGVLISFLRIISSTIDRLKHKLFSQMYSVYTQYSGWQMKVQWTKDVQYKCAQTRQHSQWWLHAVLERFTLSWSADWQKIRRRTA
jgi:hypothetical protein